MRNIKLTLEYDGTDFCGWQWQPNVRTVQETLQNALSGLLEETPKLCAAGRTDAGVHAVGQVSNFKNSTKLDVNSIRLGLNRLLPDDVVVVDAQDVSENFHARHDAIKREYRYVISKRRRALGREFSWYCPYDLNVGQIQKATKVLIGRHVFKAFSRQVANEEHYLSNVESLVWQDNPDEMILRICANRFLHNMIRIIVGTLIDVGRGKMTLEQLAEVLESQDRDNAGATAPAKGLTLETVYY